MIMLTSCIYERVFFVNIKILNKNIVPSNRNPQIVSHVSNVNILLLILHTWTLTLVLHRLHCKVTCLNLNDILHLSTL
jgi:hypothetical protein